MTIFPIYHSHFYSNLTVLTAQKSKENLYYLYSFRHSLSFFWRPENDWLMLATAMKPTNVSTWSFLEKCPWRCRTQSQGQMCTLQTAPLPSKSSLKWLLFCRFPLAHMILSRNHLLFANSPLSFITFASVREGQELNQIIKNETDFFHVPQTETRDPERGPWLLYMLS